MERNGIFLKDSVYLCSKKYQLSNDKKMTWYKLIEFLTPPLPLPYKGGECLAEFLWRTRRQPLPSLPLELCSLATEGTQEGEKLGGGVCN